MFSSVYPQIVLRSSSCHPTIKPRFQLTIPLCLQANAVSLPRLASSRATSNRASSLRRAAPRHSTAPQSCAAPAPHDPSILPLFKISLLPLTPIPLREIPEAPPPAPSASPAHPPPPPPSFFSPKLLWHQTPLPTPAGTASSLSLREAPRWEGGGVRGHLDSLHGALQISALHLLLTRLFLFRILHSALFTQQTP